MRVGTKSVVGVVSAALVSSVLSSGVAVGSANDAKTEVDRIAKASEEYKSKIAILRGAGLSDQQILALLRDPKSATTWTSNTLMSSNVALSEEPTKTSVKLADGTYATPKAGSATAAAAAVWPPGCGWAITNHIGSTFAVESAKLYLRTDWCWKNGQINGTPTSTHRSSVTLYGTAGGWRVNPSYTGAQGWIGKDYKTEAKADWRLVACIPWVGCVTVQTGTAWAQHRLTGQPLVYKNQGGWP